MSARTFCARTHCEIGSPFPWRTRTARGRLEGGGCTWTKKARSRRSPLWIGRSAKARPNEAGVSGPFRLRSKVFRSTIRRRRARAGKKLAARTRATTSVPLRIATLYRGPGHPRIRSVERPARLLTVTPVSCNPRYMTERRDELLRRSRDYLLAHGVADLSLRPLAAAIGTSARLLVYHFGSKEALVTAVLDDVRHRFQASFTASPRIRSEKRPGRP